jgi:hypothetical protein
MSSRTGFSRIVPTTALSTAVLWGASACAGETQPAAQLGSQTSSTSATPDPGMVASSVPTAVGKPAGGAKTADLALSGWVAELIKGDYRSACGLMGQDGRNGAPAIAMTGPQCQQMTSSQTTKNVLVGLHKTFTPGGTDASPKVTTTGLKADGASATATDADVRIDGKLLRDVIIANSRGIPAGVSTTTFELRQINKLWYVTNFDIKV